MREFEFADGKSQRERVHITAFFIALAVTTASSQAIAQTQYSIGNPTNEQQYMLELNNRARANGGARQHASA